MTTPTGLPEEFYSLQEECQNIQKKIESLTEEQKIIQDKMNVMLQKAFKRDCKENGSPLKQK